MRSIRLLLIVLVCLAARTALADMSTPWVENAKVGTEQTAHAWVIAMNAEQTVFNVLVFTDRHTPVVLVATVEKGVVPADTLGKPAMVKAKVTKQADGVTTEVQILQVTPVK